jgi:hypothetical protein
VPIERMMAVEGAEPRGSSMGELSCELRRQLADIPRIRAGALF